MAHSLRVAQRWFVREKLADDVTWLTEPHVNPLLRCNIWHVRGRDADLLIDTGLGVASLRAELADLIDRPLIAIASHIHYDHVGGLHEFDDVRLHALEAARMSDYQEFQGLRRADFSPGILESLVAAGYEVNSECLLDAIPHAGFDPGAYRIRSTSAASLRTGEVLDLGDRHFEVLHLPGHSPGSIGLWEAKTQILFSGDAIYDGPLLDELPDSNISDYVATMKRLADLPVGIVHAGHDPSFGRGRLRALVAAYLARRDPD